MLDASCACSFSQKILLEENLSELYHFCRKSTLFSFNWINTTKSRCRCFNTLSQEFGWWRPQSQPTSPAEGKIRSFQCKLVVFITLILWTHLPAWDDLSGWQDKPVGSSVAQLSCKCKPICFQFGITGFDKYSWKQYWCEYESSLAGDLHIQSQMENLEPKTPLYQSSEAPAAGSEVGNAIS